MQIKNWIMLYTPHSTLDGENGENTGEKMQSFKSSFFSQEQKTPTNQNLSVEEI